MLTAVAVPAPIGATFDDLVIPVIGGGPDDPLVIRNIEGLGPVDAEVTSKSYGVTDGEYYIGSKLGKRNIVLTIGINDIDVGYGLLYGYFMTKGHVTLRFDLEGFIGDSVFINGIVESNHPNHFSQDPEVQVSILCPKPNFRKDDTVITGSTQEGTTNVGEEIIYQGNMISGFEVTLAMDGAGFSGDMYFEMRNLDMGLPGYRHFKLQNVTLPGSRDVRLSSVQGAKAVESIPLDDDWKHNNLLYAMSNDTFWLTIWPGVNLFRIRTPDWENVYDWELRYSEQFGGI